MFKKKIRMLSLLLSLVLTFGLLMPGAGAETKPFKDLEAKAWYYDDVLTAAGLGLIDGYDDGSFRPGGGVTVAQAVKLAACVYQASAEGAVSLKNGQDAWYDTYVDYALEKGIMAAGFSDYAADITRAQFAALFAKALPAGGLDSLNMVPDGAIKDVAADSPSAEAIYTLYRAGVLQGDAGYRFNPKSGLKRSEAAAILARMMDPAARIGAPAIAVPDHDETFIIVHTNDVHGFVDIEPYVKPVADAYKAVYGDKNVITVSAGDVYSGGDAFAGKYKGELIPPVMDAAGYDILVPGNNDFDYGADALLALSAAFTHTKTLCANIGKLDAAGSPTGEQVYDHSAVFVTEKGTKVGLFGVTVVGGPLEGVYESKGTVETSVAETAKLAAQCGVVVGVGHTGWNDDMVTPSSNDALSSAAADACQGLDVYIDAHSHSVIGGGDGWYSEKTGALVTQAGSKGSHIGIVTVYIKDGQAVACAAKLLTKDYVEVMFKPDPATQALVDAGKARLQEELGAVIGHTDYYLNGDRYDTSPDDRSIRCDETNLGDLICDAIRDYAKADIAMFPGYLIRSSIPAGDMTGINWTSVFGKGGTVYLFEKTGEEVLALMKASAGPVPNETPQFYQFSGASFGYSKKDGEVTLENVTVGGQPIDPAKTYLVAYDGADPNFDKEANKDKLIIDGAEQLVQIMAAYLASGKAVIHPDVPMPDKRIIKGEITGTTSMAPPTDAGGGGTPPPKP